MYKSEQLGKRLMRSVSLERGHGLVSKFDVRTLTTASLYWTPFPGRTRKGSGPFLFMVVHEGTLCRIDVVLVSGISTEG